MTRVGKGEAPLPHARPGSPGPQTPGPSGGAGASPVSEPHTGVLPAEQVPGPASASLRDNGPSVEAQHHGPGTTPQLPSTRQASCLRTARTLLASVRQDLEHGSLAYSPALAGAILEVEEELVRLKAEAHLRRILQGRHAGARHVMS